MIRLLILLVGCNAWAQQVTPLAVPTVSDVRSFTRTNANGDTVVTTVIPKPKPAWKHYYGVFDQAEPQMAYIGEMTDESYQVWANQGTTVQSGGPQVKRWLFVFSTTNKIEPVLVHFNSERIR